MRPLQVADAQTIILGLQDEIRRSEESRYDHRLHGVLLVAQGMTCPEVSRLLGDAPRSVEYWVRRFEARGLGGLVEGQRSGRPPRLSEAQLREVDRVLRQAPCDLGLTGTLWDVGAILNQGSHLAPSIPRERVWATSGLSACATADSFSGERWASSTPSPAGSS